MRWLPVLLLPTLLAAAPVDPVRQTWTHLTATTNQCPEVFDYFPGGGLRILYCHAKQDLAIAQVAELAGVPIWVAGGPHGKATGLDLANHREFGHYNPAFVTKIVGFALPAAKDTKFREQTQSTYDTVLQSRARIAWVAHERLAIDSRSRQTELEAYKANMKAAEPDPYFVERWYDYVETPDGNVAKTLVAWWLRRYMDGTEDEWVPVLRRTMELYDGAWLAQHERPREKPPQ